MGLGRFGGGLGAVRYLSDQGARVTVTDLRGPELLEPSLAELAGLELSLVLGEHRREDFEATQTVVVNPAVPPGSEYLALARRAGAELTSDVELFLEAAPARLVAITGTQGKSSTAHLLRGLLARSSGRAFLAGNIGRSPLDLLDRLGSGDTVVLELSSYQLEHLEQPGNLAGRIAAVGVTNVLRDHLERHGSPEAYAAAKWRILELLDGDGLAVLPARDPVCAGWVPPRGHCLRFDAGPGAEAPLRIEGEHFVLEDEPLARIGDLALPGEFQRENALLALGLARRLGAPAADLAGALGGLRGIPHRLEDLGLRDGRRIWDNGVSTTPDSTLSALRSLPAPCTLVLGGQAKALPLEELVQEARSRVRLAVTFGAAAQPLARALELGGVSARIAESLERAVGLALAETPPGGHLLFSPACASFDAYPNFRERALAFRAALPPADPAP